MKVSVGELEKERDRKLTNIEVQAEEQMLIEKQLRNKQRQITDLKNRGEQYNEELVIMMKTDMLVRERLDFKKHVEYVNQMNRRNLEEAKDNLVYRSGSGIRKSGGFSSAFVDRKDQG